MNYVVAIVLVVALALLYPGIKDTARSEAKDEYENTIKSLRKSEFKMGIKTSANRIYSDWRRS